MTGHVRVVAMVAMATVCAAPAGAQGLYVSAAVLADVVRPTQTEYPGAPESSGGGEAIGFALRAGTPLGAIWGVEIEFARPGEIEGGTESRPIPLTQTPIPFDPVSGLPVRVPVVTAFFYQVETSERNTTLSTALWVRQSIAARAEMVYLGGIAFSRSELESEVTYAPLFTTLSMTGLILPPMRTAAIVYGVQPMVGVESRLEMSGRAHLVPGLRLHASDGRWLIRPSVGVSWTF